RRSVRRRSHPPAHRRRKVPARSRRAESTRTCPVPAARVRRGDPRIQAGASDRSRRPSGALQPDALVSGPRPERGRRARTPVVRAVQGRRIVAVDHRAVPSASPRRQQRAAGDPRAPMKPTLVAVLALVAMVFADAGPMFTDVTAAAGIRFRHNSGAFGRKSLPETMGAGAAFLDADGDGWPDVLLVNSKNWPGHPGPPTRHALYHNNHDGT